jgi:hypothetical protein
MPNPPTTVTAMDQAKQDSIEAVVFRRLVQHLDAHKEVQNIDLMNLAGFCRNCLGKWYAQAAREAGEEIADEAARERIYGMPYAEWKKLYQT